jgi:RNA polymerase sigma-70 factor (ECF subfamily)
MVIRRIARVPPLPAHRGAQEDMPDWSDRELLSALAEGDPRAGLVLYDRLIRVVEWTILRIMGQRSIEHEDLVQAAFEQIVVTLRRARYRERCSLTSWASAISCHLALNALRTRRRQRALSSETASHAPEPGDPSSLENQLAARQALERVRTELSRMNPGRAQALVLHEVNGLELAEIAAVLGISVGAAQSRLSRGRRELLERLAATGGAAVFAAPASARVPARRGGGNDE